MTDESKVTEELVWPDRPHYWLATCHDRVRITVEGYCAFEITPDEAAIFGQVLAERAEEARHAAKTA